jgi:hypothetical protein
MATALKKIKEDRHKTDQSYKIYYPRIVKNDENRKMAL